MEILDSVPVEIISTPEMLKSSSLWEEDVLALDLETTSLQIYRKNFRVRLVALATPTQAWVVATEGDIPERSVANAILSSRLRLVMHTGLSFDIPALWRNHPRTAREAISRRTRDVRVLGHLKDPRGREEGGYGHSLDDLAAHYLNQHKTGDELKEEFTRLVKAGLLPKGSKMDDRFSLVPIDNEVYHRYAATDAVLTARLLGVLS